jgi:uncharacterized membrane protein
VKDQQRSARQLELGTARVEAFSDGFMAVIITIMALELRAPRGATLDAVREQLPGLLVYVLSFVIIGIYWNNHHHLLRSADRISGAAMTLLYMSSTCQAAWVECCGVMSLSTAKISRAT